jgi:hypothetical protein
MRRFLVLCACGASLSLVPTAAAKPTPHHNSSVTINVLSDSTVRGYYGRVSSGPKQCEVGRRVILRLGPGGDQVDVGSDVTSSEGDWLIAFDAPLAGHYQAFAPRTAYHRHGIKHVCDAAKSPRILDA